MITDLKGSVFGSPMKFNLFCNFGENCVFLFVDKIVSIKLSNRHLLSTKIKVNSTFRKSSTATIMSLKMATSSPWRLSRPSNETSGPVETQIEMNFGSGSTHQNFDIRPETRVVRAWEKQTSLRWRTAWLRLTASLCCCRRTMLQAVEIIVQMFHLILDQFISR